MRYFITSSKDATIYTSSLSQNTGIDQILEVRNFDEDDFSRALIEFDVSGIDTGSNFKASLFLTSTKLRELAFDFNLEILPISQSWDMGLGKRQDDPINTDGVSWLSRSAALGSWDSAGGDFITSPTASFKYNQKAIDLNVDVTEIVNSYLSGSITNNGFAIKYLDSTETSSVNYGAVNFFSSETHTIYRPKVIIEWDDSDNSGRDTGSVSVVDADDVFISLPNLKQEYVAENNYRFNIFARDEFPSLTFTTGSPYSVNKYLPTASQYSVVDNVTEDVIVPFSENSRVSSDVSESFFRLNFKGWEPERNYRIIIKVDDGNNINFIDKNFTFKLVE